MTARGLMIRALQFYIEAAGEGIMLGTEPDEELARSFEDHHMPDEWGDYDEPFQGAVWEMLEQEMGADNA